MRAKREKIFAHFSGIRSKIRDLSKKFGQSFHFFSISAGISPILCPNFCHFFPNFRPLKYLGGSLPPAFRLVRLCLQFRCIKQTTKQFHAPEAREIFAHFSGIRSKLRKRSRKFGQCFYFECCSCLVYCHKGILNWI